MRFHHLGFIILSPVPQCSFFSQRRNGIFSFLFPRPRTHFLLIIQAKSDWYARGPDTVNIPYENLWPVHSSRYLLSCFIERDDWTVNMHFVEFSLSFRTWVSRSHIVHATLFWQKKIGVIWYRSIWGLIFSNCGVRRTTQVQKKGPEARCFISTEGQLVKKNLNRRKMKRYSEPLSDTGDNENENKHDQELWRVLARARVSIPKISGHYPCLHVVKSEGELSSHSYFPFEKASSFLATS